MSELSSREIFGLAGITLLAAILRFWELNTALWYDEIATVIQSLRMPVVDIITSYPSNNDHPFYSLLAGTLINVFGESPWLLRVPAALFGAATVPVIYLLARNFVAKQEAAAATFLLAVSYHHIWFSQNARGYTLIMFLALLCSHLLYKAIVENQNRELYLVMYAVLLALAAYTHLTAALIGVAHALCLAWYYILEKKSEITLKTFVWPASAFLVAGLLTVLLYLPMIDDVLSFFISESEPVAISEMQDVADEVSEAPQPVSPVNTVWMVLAAVDELAQAFGGLVVLLVAGVLFAIGLLSYWSRSRFFVVMFLLPIPVIVLATQLLGRPIFPRFFLFELGFLLIVGVRGIAVLINDIVMRMSKGHHERMVFSLVIGVAAIVFLSGLPAIYAVPKQDFAAAVREAEALGYSGREFTVTKPTRLPVSQYLQKDWGHIETYQDLVAQLETRNDFLIVYTFSSYLVSGNPLMWSEIQQHCRTRATISSTVRGGEIYVATCQKV